MNPLQPCPQDCPIIKASQRSPRQLRLQLHTNHPSNLLQSHHVSSHPSLLHSPQVTLPPISLRKENQLSIPKSISIHSCICPWLSILSSRANSFTDALCFPCFSSAQEPYAINFPLSGLFLPSRLCSRSFPSAFKCPRFCTPLKRKKKGKRKGEERRGE